jgi:hypothetical protein
MSSATLDAIKKHNLIFISAQPDEPYFHWQVELYLYNFSKHGLTDQCHAVFSYKNKPSDGALNIGKKFKHIHFYKDTRIHGGKYHYEPSIRPHILKQFFTDFPELGKNVFYHDSDILFVHLPKFELMLEDDIAHLSDTIGYNGSNYLKGISAQHKAKFPALPENDLFSKMCECLEISEELVSSNELNTGGAQYLIKKIDAQFWIDIEKYCVKLHKMMGEYYDKYPIDTPCQKWCSDMWSVLWVYWKRGSKTVVDKDLSFSWATSTALEYHTNNIFHYAGVDDKNDADKFGKFRYKTKCPFKSYLCLNSEYEHIPPENATHEFVKVIKEYAKTMDIKDVVQFSLQNKEFWASTYTKDDSVIICGSPVYRSECKKYLMFNNGSSWGITYSIYESELKEGSGSILTCSCIDPHLGGWNNSKIDILKVNDTKMEGNEITEFLLVCSNNPSCSAVYIKDRFKIICGRAIWRSAKQDRIIFYNKTNWMLTDSKYENELTEGSGGLMQSSGRYAYSFWNNCTITIL